MDNRIEAFLNKELSPEEIKLFEEDLKNDPALADELAFFLSVKRTLADKSREEKLQVRHQEWTNRKSRTPVRRLPAWIPAVAAAVIVMIGLAWLLYSNQPTSLQEFAAGYVSDNFSSMSVLMNSDEQEKDSLQMAIIAFNNEDLTRSSEIISQVLAREPENAEALKIAGITSVRSKEYDQAITYFQRLGDLTTLYGNPGRFYEAVARIEEGGKENVKKSEELLKEVIDKDLEGAKIAREWLSSSK